MYRSGCSDKKMLRLACFPFNVWIGLEFRRVLWLVNTVFLFGDRGIQIRQFFDSSFHPLGLFPNNKFIVLLTVISISCAIAICFRRSISMTLTVITSLTEVAAVTFEK